MHDVLSYTDDMELPTPVISVRLDAESAAALRLLEAAGRTRSEAVRLALVRAAAEARTRASIAAEAAAIAADPADRAEAELVRGLMEDLRAPW
jgi:Arc/MetJ-type ribon-helix-helix transcriptional regulator